MAGMKIYTRTGDQGETGLIGGKRLRKDDPRIDCYGTVDELNALLGLCAAVLEGDDPLLEPIRQVQNDLFVLGSNLAAPDPAKNPSLPQLSSELIVRLEAQIDAWQQALPPLKQFILPGGAESGARLHVARTVCRRAERLLTALSAHQPVPSLALTYLNRLSDWLFVIARTANHARGAADIPWVK